MAMAVAARTEIVEIFAKFEVWSCVLYFQQ